MTVHRYLVTASTGSRMDLWAATGAYANWIEGRGPQERETWLVTCFAEHSSHFLAAARQRADATVEEIEGAGDAEQYVLVAGEPGTQRFTCTRATSATAPRDLSQTVWKCTHRIHNHHRVCSRQPHAHAIPDTRFS